MKYLLGENIYPLSIDTAAETVATLLGEARNERYLKTANYSLVELAKLDELIKMMVAEKNIISGFTIVEKSERMRVFKKVAEVYCPTLKERRSKLNFKSNIKSHSL